MNLDADELPRWLVKHLLRVVKWCSVFDLIWIPRKNIVTGLTSEDIKLGTGLLVQISVLIG